MSRSFSYVCFIKSCIRPAGTGQTLIPKPSSVNGRAKEKQTSNPTSSDNTKVPLETNNRDLGLLWSARNFHVKKYNISLLSGTENNGSKRTRSL